MCATSGATCAARATFLASVSSASFRIRSSAPKPNGFVASDTVTPIEVLLPASAAASACAASSAAVTGSGLPSTASPPSVASAAAPSASGAATTTAAATGGGGAFAAIHFLNSRVASSVPGARNFNH